MSDTYIARGEGRRRIAKTKLINVDNGAGATIDDCILNCSQPILIKTAYILYTTETSGLIAAGNAKIGTAVAGAEIVAATAYEAAKTVGTTTAMVLTTAGAAKIAASTAIYVRHTGVVATPLAGEVYVVIEYVILP